MKPLVKALVDFPLASLVDIGANIGLYSLQAATMNRTSFAFEHSSQTIDAFVIRYTPIRVFKNLIKRFNVTVMHESTNVKLQAGWRNQGGTRVVSYGKDETGKDIGGIAYTHGVTLDDMIKYLPKGQVVLKIDTEGAECKALAGGLDKYLQQIDIVYTAIEWS